VHQKLLDLFKIPQRTLYKIKNLISRPSIQKRRHTASKQNLRNGSVSKKENSIFHGSVFYGFNSGFFVFAPHWLTFLIAQNPLKKASNKTFETTFPSIVGHNKFLQMVTTNC